MRGRIIKGDRAGRVGRRRSYDEFGILNRAHRNLSPEIPCAAKKWATFLPALSAFHNSALDCFLRVQLGAEPAG